MVARTPAGKLVSAFGDWEAMARLYAPDVEWSLPATLGFPRPMKGLEVVRAFNEEVWTVYYRPDCSVTILDEAGDERISAVRFIYQAHALRLNRVYQNEYTIFVRADETGIREVHEAFDTAFAANFLSQDPV